MKLKLEICIDNDAFTGRPGAEAARILRKIADDAEEYDGAENFSHFDVRPRDLNGNRVGSVSVEE